MEWKGGDPKSHVYSATSASEASAEIANAAAATAVAKARSILICCFHQKVCLKWSGLKRLAEGKAIDWLCNCRIGIRCFGRM